MRNIYILIAIFGISTTTFAQKTLLHCGTLIDPKLMMNVVFVMKEGVVYKQK